MDLPEVFDLDLRLLYLAGLAPFRYSKTKKRVVSSLIDNFCFLYSFSIIAITSVIMILFQPLLGKIANISTEDLQLADAGKVIYNSQNLQAGYSFITYISLLICSSMKKRPHMKLIQRLFGADIELQHLFNVNINYDKEKKQYKMLITYMIFYILIGPFVIIIYLSFTQNNLVDNRMVPIYAASFFSTPVHSLHYYILCKTIASRMKIIQELADTALSKSKFEALLEVNKHLRKCIECLNDAHGVSQLISLVNDCIILTMYFFVIFYVAFSPKGFVFLHWAIAGSFWITLFLGKIIYTALIGECLKNQVTATNKSLSGNLSRRYKGKEMELLSGCPLDKLYGFQLKCTAADFLDIDNAMISLVFANILTYLVILLQFQLDEA